MLEEVGQVRLERLGKRLGEVRKEVGRGAGQVRSERLGKRLGYGLGPGPGRTQARA